MWMYIAILVLVLILALVLFIAINNKTKKGRVLKTINNLENEKLEINKIQVNAKLIKISMIGQSNVVFQSLYQEHKQAYDSIMKEYNDSLDASIKETRDFCMQGDYKHVNENIKNITIRLESFKDEITKLYALVSDVLKDEDELNEKIEPLRQLFNDCESLYNEYKENINFNINKYDAIFQNIKEKFSILNDYMMRGNYLDAKDLIASLNDEINKLHDNLTTSPKKVDTVINEIPNLLNNVIEKYNDMQHNEYPLYNVLANQTISLVKDELKKLIYKVQNFDYDDVEEKSLVLTTKIQKLDKDLEHEKRARIDYEARMKEIYDHASDLEALYLANLRKHTKLDSFYCSNKELDEIMSNIKHEVNTLNAIRRQLDSLNYGMQPYSIRLNKLNELDDQNVKVQSLITKYDNYVNGMKDTCENSNDLVKNSAANLKRLELKVRNSNVSGLINMYNDSFINGYQLISKLESTIKTVPIDVKKADLYTSRLDELVTELQTNLEKDLLLLKEAEKLLMFSAQYKYAFADFEKAHIKAEGYFYDCRYESAIEILLDALDHQKIEVPFEIRGIDR